MTVLGISQGHTTSEIGATLSVSAVTVRLFLQQAQKKLKAKSREHAVALAIRQRLI